MGLKRLNEDEAVELVISILRTAGCRLKREPGYGGLNERCVGND